jgi:pimeloyl-ACP methyl ester carboxylesterase
MLLSADKSGAQPDLIAQVEHGYAVNKDTKIHYVSLGRGPLVVLLHGFPDFWLTWRNQMPALADHYRVVALDLRGYNRSDKPQGVKNYRMHHLVEDVLAVIRHLGEVKAILVGHDWGGAICWSLAMRKPEYVDRLIILNSPHPRGLIRTLAMDARQRESSRYAYLYQKEGAHKRLDAESLAEWVDDPWARQQTVEALERSDFEAILNYYRAHYPREPYNEDIVPKLKVQCPVLMIHGLDDKYLLPGALNGTWNWVDAPLTLTTVPNAGHFVHHDAADQVTQLMIGWLKG